MIEARLYSVRLSRAESSVTLAGQRSKRSSYLCQLIHGETRNYLAFSLLSVLLPS